MTSQTHGTTGDNPFFASTDFASALARRDPFAVPNPFDGDEEPRAAASRERYVLTRSAPEVDPKEVELADTASLEVMILWGETVLHVAHLTPPRSFYVGEEEKKNLACDYFLPEEKLGATRLPVVLADAGGVRLVVPRGCRGTLELPASGKRSVRDLVTDGQARPCAELAGAFELPIPAGARARLQLGDLVFLVSAVNAGRKPTVGLLADRDWTSAAFVGLSSIAHVCLLSAVAFFMPPLGLSEAEASERDQMYLIKQYLAASAEREAESRPAEQTATDRPDDREGGSGVRAIGEEGSMGRQTSTATNRRWAIRGPADNTDIRIAHTQALRDAQSFGVIGLLNNGAVGDPNAPVAPWGRDEALGRDPVSAMGNMWGPEIGEAHGAGGLGLSGIGEAGGGRGEGIGLGSVGTINHGAGTGDGQGFGPGHGAFARGHKPVAPQVRIGTTNVTGKIPPEVVQRIVRQNYGRFRMCYENGLRGNPSLQGRVTTRFVIDRTGAVSNVANGGSDLPDPGVVQCVVSSFYGLSFPAPDGGIVTVVYPIVFVPGS